MNKGVNPYAFGANINGTWSNLGTVSPAGVWSLSGGVVNYTPTWANAVTRTVTARLQDSASINDFGGSASASTATCNTTSGSNVLTCSNVADFAVGQGVLIFGADSKTTAQPTNLTGYQCVAQNSSSPAVTGASWLAGVATLTFSEPTTFTVGTRMYITGITSAGPGSYNGTVVVQSSTNNTVSYVAVTDPGAYTSGGQITTNIGWCTPGSQTYYYSVAALTQNGAIGTPIAEIAVTGPDALSAYNFNTIRWKAPATNAPAAYVILGHDSVLRPNRRPIGYQNSLLTTTVSGDTYIYWKDFGPDNVFNLTTTPDETWMPNSADVVASTYGWYRGVISAVDTTAKTLTITTSTGVAKNAAVSLVSQTVYHENTIPLQRALNAVKTVSIPCGTYNFAGEPITMNASNTIMGSSRDCSIFNITAGILGNTRSFIKGTSVDGMHIENIAINGNNHAQANAALISGTATPNAVVKNNSLTYFQNFGVSLFGGNDMAIASNKIYLQYPFLSQNQCINVASSGASTFRTTNMIMADNYCDGSGIFGTFDNSNLTGNIVTGTCFGAGIADGASSATYANSIINNVVKNTCTETANTASFTGSIDGSVMTITDAAQPNPVVTTYNFRIGESLTAPGLLANTKIVAFGDALGNTGTYQIYPAAPSPIASGPIVAYGAYDTNATPVSCLEIWGTDDIVSSNTLFNCNYGVKLGAKRGVLTNNKLYDNGGAGILLNSSGSFTAENATILGNSSFSSSGYNQAYSMINSFTNITGIVTGENHFEGGVNPLTPTTVFNMPYAGPYNNDTLQLATTTGAISSASWAAGTATVLYSNLYRYQIGQAITVSGTSPSGYDGVYEIVDSPATTSRTAVYGTYAVAVDPGGTSTTGSISIGGGFGKIGTTLTTIDYLRHNVQATNKYAISAKMNFTADAAAGVKFGVGGTDLSGGALSISNMAVDLKVYCMSTAPATLVTAVYATSLSDFITTKGCTSYYGEMNGTITINENGSIGPKFAQDTDTPLVPSVMLNGSTFRVVESDF